MRCFPLKENKDILTFEFCSLMNLSMYKIKKLFHSLFACTIFIYFLFTFRPFPRIPLLMAFNDHTAITCVALISHQESDCNKITLTVGFWESSD